MRLSELKKYGLPTRVIDVWRQRQGELLLPVQSKAVRKGLLDYRSEESRSCPVNMIIAAPTSSGKSFCAELAAIRALTARRKTIILFPLKSLAEQKYRLFNEAYAPLGIKCLIATGDHPENDRAFASGDYQIALAIYEKFDLLLTSSLDALSNIGLVVIDEIQSVVEPGRGAILERLLTKIRASVYQPTLIGLSAVIGDNSRSAGRLAEWLKAVLVEETARPVDLIRGVAAEGSFKYRSYNDHLDGTEPFIKIEAGDDPFDGFVRQVRESDGSTLVFLKSRLDTVNGAFKLASMVNWPAATKGLESLQDEELSYLIRSLRQAMSRGVAFHNSDLSSRQRIAVEQAFINKEVKVIFSTTTLAMGVNLPADTVYLETVKYSSGRYNSSPSLVPVSRAEFDNMTGRAGRLQPSGQSRQGRAIVMAESAFERDVLWENYIAGDHQQMISSAFDSLPVVDWVLDMIVSGLGSSDDSFETLFRHTLQYSISKVKPPDFRQAVEILLDEGLVSICESTGRPVATTTGRVAAQSGLSVREVRHYLNKLGGGRPDNLAGWVALALSGPGWNLPPAILSRFEQANKLPLQLLYQKYDHLTEEAAWLLPENYRHVTMTYREAAGLKAFLMLYDWCRMVPIQKLEEQFQIHLGQIINLGQSVAHLVTALGRLMESFGRDRSSSDKLDGYAFSLRHGLPEKWRPWQSQFGDMLNRADYEAFEKASIFKLSQIGQFSLEELRKIIPSKRKSLLLKEQATPVEEEVYMQSNVVNIDRGLSGRPVIPFKQPESVEIDGSYERERYLVRINGFPIRLTGKSFKYFTKLAWKRANHDSGWIYKEDIEAGFNQARYLYRMKNEINAGINLDWPIIENNRLGYYRLNVLPSKININFTNLENHPDFELQQLAKNRPSGTVN